MSLFGSIKKLINQTSTEVINHQIPKKVSDLITTTISSGFQVVDDVLDITKKITQEPKPESKPET